MKSHQAELPEERPATDSERNLVGWLLENGKPEARDYLPQVAYLCVRSRCRCGCASVNFTDPFRPAGDVLSDYQWRDAADNLNGVFVWASAGILAGLELWSIDGAATPTVLPDPSVLRPLDELL